MYVVIFIVVFGVIAIVKWPKVTANFNGERLCVHCKKRLRFDGPNGHYASTCPRCGKSQPER